MLGIYFSGTGNTKYCVRQFLKKCDNDSKDYAIEEVGTIEAIKKMEDEELLVFGYSVQYSNLPKMLKDFVMENKELWKKKKVYVIATMGAFSGDGAGMLGRLLTKYKANVIGGLHLCMPDSICDVKTLKHSPEADQKTIENSMVKIDRAVERLKDGHPNREGLGLLYHCAGLFGQRLYFYNKTKMYSNKLKIEESKCSGCGLCVEHCPMHNLELQKIAVAKDRCTMCYRCVNECPKKAITLLGKNVVKQRKSITG